MFSHRRWRVSRTQLFAFLYYHCLNVSVVALVSNPLWNPLIVSKYRNSKCFLVVAAITNLISPQRLNLFGSIPASLVCGSLGSLWNLDSNG